MAGRRPRNRKEQIVEAASELFRERGYHNVSVADVTTKVDIGASALYRHFRNKNELLYAAVLTGLESLQESVDGVADLPELLATLAAGSAERRGLPLLWQREARYLDAEQRTELRERLRGITSRVADLIAAARPELTTADCELIGFSVLATLSSTSAHRIVLPRRRMEALLSTLSTRVAHTPLGTSETDEQPATDGFEIPVSRREQLLAAAIRLFDERGYQTVLTEDIGEACGTTGPNVYNYFDAKIDLLVAAMTRGFDRRAMVVRQALAGVTDARDMLDRLVRAHIDVALENGNLVGLMASELNELPENTRKICTQEQRDYLHLWTRAVAGVRPGIDPTEARITISAVLTMVANAARTPRLRRRTDLAERLAEISMAMLFDPTEVPGAAGTAAATAG
ncbi:TetR family transcriptional regulator [Nocardia sp. MDA0666]|uniref:TetR/AcrR family transcriptional regulator n=1 Tax=Nocardia sp. MDA0666 TaxID=2135448 RepID=UPI000D1311EC|nr:TetR/AcrR family transcriptional regulator [Nocardia sp. MDA0666]PSR68858.1 TetR family transcriptional regulator [Nocardia sp. MDA0666]